MWEFNHLQINKMKGDLSGGADVSAECMGGDGWTSASQTGKAVPYGRR